MTSTDNSSVSSDFTEELINILSNVSPSDIDNSSDSSDSTEAAIYIVLDGSSEDMCRVLELLPPELVERIKSFQNDVPSKVVMTIHNQSPGFELVLPEYAGTGAVWYLSPDQRVDVGSTTQAGFNIYLTLDKSICILLYDLQRKDIDQSNDKVMTSKETTCIRLVTIWEVYRTGIFRVDSFLMENDKGVRFERDALMLLAEKFIGTDATGFVEKTYLLYDNAVLMIKVNSTREEECYKINMTISEGSIYNDIRRPRYIGRNG
jgi:hypothetical protein